jgi:hypothetical protein
LSANSGFGLDSVTVLTPSRMKRGAALAGIAC